MKQENLEQEFLTLIEENKKTIEEVDDNLKELAELE